MYGVGLSESDLKVLMDLHEGVSKTFDLALDNVSGPLRDVVGVSYLMCRIPDTLEDSSVVPVDEQVELLEMYENVLNGSGEDVDDFVSAALEYRGDAVDSGEKEEYWDLIEETDRVFRVFDGFDEEVKQCARENIGEMTEGMKEICSESSNGIRIQDRGEFEQYCFYVAGTVGNMLTDFFVHEGNYDSETEESLRKYAEDFGEGLQTINILKDVRQDYNDENAIFFPETVLQDNDASQRELEMFFEGERGIQPDLFEDAMEEMVYRGQEKLEKAELYLQSIPEDSHEIRQWALTPYLLAVATLREAEERTLEPIETNGVKISKNEALTITDKVPYWESQNSIEETTELIYDEEQTCLKNKVKIGLKDTIDTLRYENY